MLVKRCFKCGDDKPLFDYYRHPQMADGHLNKCKVCAKKDVGEHRRNNLEQVREYDRGRSALPHRRALRNRTTAEWIATHPQERRAHHLVNNAVRSGKLLPEPCYICGEKAEAHHPDYSNPLDVVWLCSAHHKQAHAMARAA